MIDGSRIPRRQALKTLGALGVGAAASGLAPVKTVHAQAPTLGQNESVQDAMKRLFGGRTIKDGSAIIKFDIPLIAENGSVVPVAVSVDSPMTASSYVKHIYIVADKNRIPVVTRVTLAPARRRWARTSGSVRPGRYARSSSRATGPCCRSRAK
jgi:sulfur-oxidizing protein SoxY